MKHLLETLVLYFMLEGFGCVQNQVQSTYGEKAQCTEKGQLALS